MFREIDVAQDGHWGAHQKVQPIAGRLQKRLYGHVVRDVVREDAWGKHECQKKCFHAVLELCMLAP